MNDLTHILLRRNIRPTAMRLLVLDFFSRKAHAVSLGELEEGMERSDRATLYRTLKTFEEHKAIHRVDDGSGVIKYGLCEESCECNYLRDTHVHFSCKVCGETRCLPGVKVPAIELPNELSPAEANLVVRGICEHCA